MDVTLKLKSDGGFDTSVFIKPTDKGLYASYNSHIPSHYKQSVISSLVRRALKFSSTPEAKTAELSRITQILVNNGYPQFLIEKTIRAKLQQMNDIHSSSTIDEPSDVIHLYTELHNVSNFKSDSKKLKGIISRHVHPADQGKCVKLTTFYKPLKLSSMFSTRTRPAETERTCLVYQFNCPEPSCHEVSYIGYTNQKLSTRVKQHRSRTSSIFKHFMDEHNDAPPLTNELVKSFNIIYSSHGDLMSVKIAEAILIKNNRPQINIKYNELYDFLRLY